MAIADITPAAAAVPVSPVVVAPTATEPRPWRFNVEQYYRMGEVGVFGPEDRVELINGAIIRMNPIGNRHARCVNRLNQLLVVAFLGKADIGIGNPVHLDDSSEPQPDFTILKIETKDSKVHPKPSDVVVAIEVSDSSLQFDRGIKAPLYAAAGIPEFWIVDLEAETIEVRRKPNATSYEELQTFRRSEQVRCFAFPDIAFNVAAILG